MPPPSELEFDVVEFEKQLLGADSTGVLYIFVKAEPGEPNPFRDSELNSSEGVLIGSIECSGIRAPDRKKGLDASQAGDSEFIDWKLNTNQTDLLEVGQYAVLDWKQELRGRITRIVQKRTNYLNIVLDVSQEIPFLVSVDFGGDTLVAWGKITGSISDQPDLNTKLVEIDNTLLLKVDATVLNDYITSGQLGTALADYVTTTQLDTRITEINTVDPTAIEAELATKADIVTLDNYTLLNDARLTDAREPLAHNQAFSTITGLPTNLAGYGITDAVITTDSRLSDSRNPLPHDQAWSTITGTPTTLTGYGISDAVTTTDPRLTDARTPLAHSQPWSSITTTPTTVAGYGITDAVATDDTRLTDSRPSTWGQVGGTLSDQVDLIGVLNAKQNLNTNLTTLSALTTVTSYGADFLKITDAAAARLYIGVDGSGSATASWGQISGTLADQADLTTALSGKVSDTDPRLSDAREPLAHNQAWVTITGTPTTVTGYGITDAVVITDTRLSDAREPLAHTQAWSTITATPTTLLGYGITDAVETTDSRLSDARTPLAHNQAWSTITLTPTTIAGYGITDAVITTDSRLSDARASTWGQVGGLIADQVDLINALNGKQELNSNLTTLSALTGLTAYGTDFLKITDAAAARLYIGIDGSGSATASWGQISGTLADQTDLNTALAGKVADTDPRLTDARTPLAHNQDWSTITTTPTTLTGYGITDAVVNTDPRLTDSRPSTWGQVGGLLSDQTDLNTALSAKIETTDPRLSDARQPLAHNQDFSTITATPTTISGYGITDAVLNTDTRLTDARPSTWGQISGLLSDQTDLNTALSVKIDTTDSRLSDAREPLAHTQDFSTLTNTPTTINGYGITDAVLTTDARLSDARTPLAHTQDFSTITSRPTTVAGYGITDAVLTTDTRLANTGVTAGTYTQATFTVNANGRLTAASSPYYISEPEDNGNINPSTSTVSGNTINLVPRRNESDNPPFANDNAWNAFGAKISNVLGRTPTFTVALGTTGYRFADSSLAVSRFHVVYSYDGINWTSFENQTNSTNGNKVTTFSSNKPFDQNTVYVAHLPLGVNEYYKEFSQFFTHPLVQRTASEKTNLAPCAIEELAELTPGTGLQIWRKVPRMLLYGFKVKDPNFTPTKLAIITTGSHPNENSGVRNFLGFLRFILSNDPKAVIYRQNFTTLVYPMLNPQGFMGGVYRIVPSEGIRDANRVWQDSPELVFAGKWKSVWNADITNEGLGDLRLMLDFHSLTSSTNNYLAYTNETNAAAYASFDSRLRGYYPALHTPSAGTFTSRAGRIYNYFAQEKTCYMAAVVESFTVNKNYEADALFGEQVGKTISDMVANAEI